MGRPPGRKPTSTGIDIVSRVDVGAQRLSSREELMEHIRMLIEAGDNVWPAPVNDVPPKGQPFHNERRG